MRRLPPLRPRPYMPARGNDHDVLSTALRWRELLAEPGAHLHLYGKREARAGRKMGHVTRVWPEKA